MQDAQTGHEKLISQGITASTAEEEARQEVGSGSVKELQATKVESKALVDGKEGRLKVDQTAVHAPWEQSSRLVAQHAGTEQLTGRQFAAVDAAEARHEGHQMHELRIHSAADDGNGQPGTQTDRGSMQSSSVESEKKKASIDERLEEGCAPASMPQQLERRSHSVRFSLPPSAQRPVPSKLGLIAAGKEMPVVSVAAMDGERPEAAAMGAPDRKAVKAAHRALDGGPVFVPIVMSMAEKDHLLLVEEWYGRQQVNLPTTPMPMI